MCIHIRVDASIYYIHYIEILEWNIYIYIYRTWEYICDHICDMCVYTYVERERRTEGWRQIHRLTD